MAAAVDSSPMDFRKSLARHSVVGWLTVVVLLGGFGIWAAVTEISGAVIAPASVAVEGGAKRIQHTEGGLVSDILVRNGDRVEQGDVLLRLDGTSIKASLAVVLAQLDNSFARRARLLVETGSAEDMQWPTIANWRPGAEFDALFAAEQRLLSARADTISGQQARYDEQMLQLGQQAAGLRAQQAALREELAVLTEEWSGLETLLADGLTDASRANTNRRQHASTEGQIAKLDADIAQTSSAIAERGLERVQVVDQFRSQAMEELRQLNVAIAEQLQQKIAAEDRLVRLELRSPQSGMVHGSLVQTVGGVVGQGETLMTIVPLTQHPIVEARISPLDIDQVMLGQPARVRLSGLDQRITPELDGTVASLSPTTSVDEATGVVFYEARIEIDAEDVLRLPPGTVLTPGMPAELMAETAERTVLDYLLKPLIDQLFHTFRET